MKRFRLLQYFAFSFRLWLVVGGLASLHEKARSDIFIHENSAGPEFMAAVSKTGLIPIKHFRHIPWIIYRGDPKEEAGILTEAGLQGWTVEKNRSWRLASQPDDPDVNLQWPIMTANPDADTRLKEAWNIRTDAPDIILAVIDTGARIDHEDLVNNLWENEVEMNGTPGVDDDGNGYIDDLNGWNSHQNNTDVVDANGHGTLVTGIAAAVGNNGTGVAGVCWNTRVMIVRAFTTSTTTTDALLGGIDYILANPFVDVVNASWGELDEFSQVMEDSIRLLGEQGVLFVAAAGNDGADLDVTPFYPACFDLENIVSVAAIDETGAPADFGGGFSTNFGTKVSVAAPGKNIRTTHLGGSYGNSQGTSMSAPFVAGATCLARSLVPGWSAVQLRDKLIETAVQTTALQATPLDGGLVDVESFLNSTLVASSGYWTCFD
jgi:subtilisin family serine protease